MRGTVSFDVLFDLKFPRKRGSAKVIVDIEAQNNPNPGYPLLSRGDFYVARLGSEQKERVFHRSHYEKIQKVYSIWICISPEANRRGILNRYELHEECLVGDYHFKRNEYDKFCVVMVGLGDKNSSNELIKVLSTIFDAKISSENKIELAKEHGIRVTDNFAKGVNSMCSYSEIVYKQGNEEGRAEERAVSIWQIMKKLNFSFEKAADVLDIPKKERAEFRTAVNELALKESEK